MIDKAIEELFEANISGKVSDERFVKMTDNYEKEQKELLELVADGNKKLQDAEQNKVDLKLLMKALRDYTDIRQLTPEIVNALIRRIEVHSKDKKTKKVKVDIYLTAVGLFTPPTEQELQMAMEEIRRNPQQFGDGDGGDTPKPAAVRSFCIKQNTVQPSFSGLHRILHNYFAMGLRRTAGRSFFTACRFCRGRCRHCTCRVRQRLHWNVVFAGPVLRIAHLRLRHIHILAQVLAVDTSMSPWTQRFIS